MCFPRRLPIPLPRKCCDSAGLEWNSTTFGLEQAKDSAEIDNLATTHDELLKDNVTTGCPRLFANPAGKDVLL